MTTLPQTAPMRLPRAGAPSQLAAPGQFMPGGAGAAQHSGPSSQGLTGADIWRVLRANLWLIVIMVMASAVLGYVTNQYLALHYSRFTAKALILVRGVKEIPIPGQPQGEPSPAEIELTQQTQSAILLHESLFMEAIQDSTSRIPSTSWFQQFNSEHDALAARKKDLADHFEASPIANSQLIKVQMTYSNPEDCKTIVEEMVEKHISNMRDRQRIMQTQKLDLLRNELKTVNFNLDNDVLKQLHEKERSLGMTQIGTSSSWNGQQLLLDRMMNEQARINSELAGFQSRSRSLLQDLEAGRTPAEVEQEINNNYRYQALKQQLDQARIQLATVQRAGPESDTMVALKKVREVAEELVNDTHEDLKSTYSETMKSMLQNEIDAAQFNRDRVKEVIGQINTDLASTNQTMTDYKLLQDRQKDLNVKKTFLDDEIVKLQQFSLDAPWSQAEWASKPQKPDRPSFPRLPITMAVAVFLGLALSLGIAFLREITDQTVRSPRDIARVGQLNLLGIIPHELDDPQAAAGRLPLAIFDAPHSMVAEQFRQIRTKLQHSASLDTTRSILVTSPAPGDGKTTVACNLAASLALNGRRILLVDANFRRPQLHTIFGADNAAGFGEVLNDPDLLDQCIHQTDVPNLAVLPAGNRPSNPTELLESQLFIDFIERVLSEYDHVVFDSGPMLVVSEVGGMAPRVDGVVTVVRARGNSRGLLMRMRDELRKLKAEHLGVVLNAVRSQGGGYYGRNIKTYYAYQAG